MTTRRLGLMGVLAVTMALGCGSSGTGAGKDGGSAGKGAAGAGAAGADGAGGVDGGGADVAGDSTSDAREAGTSGDADAADGGDAAICTRDGGAVTDPFAGVWTGPQGAETYAATNNGGCSKWVGTSGTTVCDVCVGTYTANGAATLDCVPTNPCSISPAHKSVGTFKVTGCSLRFDYDFGGGGSTVTITRTSDTTENVCASVDAGTQ